MLQGKPFALFRYATVLTELPSSCSVCSSDSVSFAYCMIQNLRAADEWLNSHKVLWSVVEPGTKTLVHLSIPSCTQPITDGMHCELFSGEEGTGSAEYAKLQRHFDD